MTSTADRNQIDQTERGGPSDGAAPLCCQTKAIRPLCTNGSPAKAAQTGPLIGLLASVFVARLLSPQIRRYRPKVQVSSNQGGGWGVSPAIPLVANAVLALLWSFSAFGGWGRSAFCGTGVTRDRACADEIGAAVDISLVPAGAALLIVLVALAWPTIRRDIDRLDLLLTISGFLWVLAGGIVFLFGYLAQV